MCILCVQYLFASIGILYCDCIVYRYRWYIIPAMISVFYIYSFAVLWRKDIPYKYIYIYKFLDICTFSDFSETNTWQQCPLTHHAQRDFLSQFYLRNRVNTSRLKVFKADITPPSTVRCEMYEIMRRDDTEDLCGIRDPEEEVGRGIGRKKSPWLVLFWLPDRNILVGICGTFQVCPWIFATIKASTSPHWAGR